MEHPFQKMGGVLYIHRLAPVERLTENPSAGVTIQAASSQIIQVERERERERERGYGTSVNGSSSTEQARSAGAMVADADSGAELRVLDKQSIDNSTHTQGAALLQWWLWIMRENRNEQNPISRERNT